RSSDLVKEVPHENMAAVKEKYGVSTGLASCHTAIVDGYVIEGHVPASDVKRLLKERTQVIGLAAPGMPMQSPGMQATGKPPKHYSVWAFDKQGEAKETLNKPVLFAVSIKFCNFRENRAAFS
ncbi:MAG: DUF411 domain-containing protein, partial [Ghiorsea sp.]|nr:DUF411 domain-containing protein [Ghiorsea sp.]